MLKVASLAAILALLPAAASASVLVNGDFEGGLTGWIPSGTVSALLGSVYADGIGTAATPAQRANTYAFFGGGNVTDTNTLTQSFATMIGATYNFSFEAVNVGGGAQDVSYDFGGETGSTSLSPANNFSLMQTYSGSFVAAGTTSTVSFTNFSFADGTDVALDNVSVTLVPEAATWAMMIIGFGLVGAVSRRRRIAVAA
jgi:hypothetical protein